jgi:hypothetical protein
VKAKDKWKIVFALIVVVVLLNWSTVSDLFRTSNVTDIITGNPVSDLPVVLEEKGVAPYVYFCPQDDCIGEMLLWLDAAEESVHCALFEIGLSELQEKLVELDGRVEVRVVTDNNYYDEVAELDFVRHDNRSGLMQSGQDPSTPLTEAITRTTTMWFSGRACCLLMPMRQSFLRCGRACLGRESGLSIQSS